jgi:hypothetical protein
LLNNIRLAKLGFCLVISSSCWAQGWSHNANDPEDFRIEVTGSAWIVSSGGSIQANGTPVDLVSDLNVSQREPTFYGQLVFKPARKHRIVVEGAPFRLSGLNTISRTFSYRGQNFTVSETVRSNAELDYLFAGYQYDVLSGAKGHLGFSVGGAYLSATGTIQATQVSTAATQSQTIGLPLAGADFRVFPVPGHKILELEGAIRGMNFGDYGHYVEASANGGLCLGPITFLAGYRAVNTQLHETRNGGSGVSPRLKGPIFSLMFRW